tara:strand:+ start:1471 stop:1590 length:120 start_codon:yes stop_codon:yes gene_type:complete
MKLAMTMPTSKKLDLYQQQQQEKNMVEFFSLIEAKFNRI